MSRRRDPVLEEVEDAIIDADVPYHHGTAQAALRHRDFTIVYTGTFLSNVGTWMQNVILGAYALELTGKGSYVSLLFFAQLGPLLFLSLMGGALADRVDRRRLLVALQLVQAALSVVLAFVAFGDDPSRALIVVVVFAIGIANALGAPGLSSILPTLVPIEDRPGAVALMSVQMNLSRVIGPAIGGVLYKVMGAGPVFLVNAATYGFAIVALLWARYQGRATDKRTSGGLDHLLGGVRAARADPLLSQLLATLFSFSFFSLVFVGVMPVIAKVNFGIPPKSTEYGLLYAVFGFGAACGAISVGTVLASRSKVVLMRPAFVAFAIALTVFGFLRSEVAAFPVVAVLGFVYFVAITCMSTIVQQHLTDDIRGRVMALWIMGFGGTVPLGVLVFGPLVERYGTAVLVMGAVWAMVLAVWSSAARLRRKGAPDV